MTRLGRHESNHRSGENPRGFSERPFDTGIRPIQPDHERQTDGRTTDALTPPIPPAPPGTFTIETENEHTLTVMPKTGRPLTNPELGRMRLRAFRLDDPTWDAVLARAARDGLPVAEIVRRALRDYLA